MPKRKQKDRVPLRADMTLVYGSGIFKGDECFKTKDSKAQARATLSDFGALRIGSLVKVDDDLTVGKTEYGGLGYVRVDHEDFHYDIELIAVDSGRYLKKVPLDRITIMPLSAAYPLVGSKELRRSSRTARQSNHEQGEEEDESLRDILTALREECPKTERPVGASMSTFQTQQKSLVTRTSNSKRAILLNISL